MRDANVVPRRRALTARDVLLAICVTWLLVQNSLLAVWVSHQHLGPVVTVARALLKAGVHLAGELWMVPAAALLGAGLAISTGRGEDAAGSRREVSHAGL